MIFDFPSTNVNSTFTLDITILYNHLIITFSILFSLCPYTAVLMKVQGTSSVIQRYRIERGYLSIRFAFLAQGPDSPNLRGVDSNVKFQECCIRLISAKSIRFFTVYLNLLLSIYLILLNLYWKHEL